MAIRGYRAPKNTAPPKTSKGSCPTKKYLYDLQGVEDEVTVALFDPDGFVIIRRGDLHGAWGDGYFPSGIKVYDSYLTRSGFEKLQKRGAT